MKIALFGLGIIGSAWARNLIEDGHEVRTWNRTPKSFPGETATALEAATGAELLIIVVADPPAVESVIDQIQPALVPGQIVVQSSTISPEWTVKFAERIEALGPKYLDAPFTGSKPAAEARKTVYYVGGDEATITAVKPVLEKLSSTILHVGPVGKASALKLAMNSNLAGMALALTESLTMARRAGIADHIFFEALHVNAGRSPMSDLKEPKLIAHDYSPQFSVKHMAKDLRLTLDSFSDVPLIGTPRISEMYQKGLDDGLGDEDFIGLIRLVEPA